MSTTRERAGQPVDGRAQELQQLEALWEQEPRPGGAADPTEGRVLVPAPAEPGPTARRWSVGLLVSWVLVFGVIFATEPGPADPAAPIPTLDVVLGTILLLLFPLTMAGLATGRRWGLGMSLGLAGVSMAIAITCFATGHHAGFYPYAELVVFSGFGLASWKAFRAAPPG